MHAALRRIDSYVERNGAVAGRQRDDENETRGPVIEQVRREDESGARARLLMPSCRVERYDPNLSA